MIESNIKAIVRLNSKEQFKQLKNEGSIVVDGKTIIYSPNDTEYTVKDNISQQVTTNTSNIEQLQTDVSNLETELTNKLDKNQGVENVGKFLGIDNTGDTVPLDLPKTGIIQLIGTEDNPVNLYTDTEIGQVYSVSGWVWRKPNGTRNSDKFQFPFIDGSDDVFFFNRCSSSVGTITNLYLSSSGLGGSNGNSGTLIAFNINPNHSSYVLGEIVSYTNFSTPSFNGLGAQAKQVSLVYAPTASGTTGQILQSNGTNNAPTWINNITVDTELSETSTNPVQNNIITAGLHQIEESIPTTLAELTDDSTHRLVTDIEKTTWNTKADISDIPRDNSQLTNGAGYATESAINSAVATKTAVNVNGMLQQTLNFDSDPQTQIDNLTNKGIAVYIDEGVTSITQEQLEILQADDSNYIVYGQHVFYVAQIGPNNSIRFYINISVRSELRYIYISSAGTLEARELDLPYILENNEITTTTTTQNVSSSTNNYVRLGNNLLIQWGHAHCDRDTNMTLTFDYPFADANYSIVVMNGDSSAWAAYLNGFKLEGSAAGGSGIGKTSTGCTISQYNYENDFEWIAIGRWE